jgi:hypothetical protein
VQWRHLGAGFQPSFPLDAIRPTVKSAANPTKQKSLGTRMSGPEAVVLLGVFQSLVSFNPPPAARLGDLIAR